MSDVDILYFSHIAWYSSKVNKMLYKEASSFLSVLTARVLGSDAHSDKYPVFALVHTWHSSVQPNRINCILFFNFTLIEWAHYPLSFQTYIQYLSS